MPYGEKLNSIKKELGLTNAKISDKCNVPLSTVTRIFDTKTPSGNFETFVDIARGLNFSLDKLAGLTPPSDSADIKLLKEKDDKINQLMEDVNTLREDNKTLREDNKHLRDDNKTLRKEKIRFTWILVVMIVISVLYIIIDLMNGHFR